MALVMGAILAHLYEKRCGSHLRSGGEPTDHWTSTQTGDHGARERRPSVSWAGPSSLGVTRPRCGSSDIDANQEPTPTPKTGRIPLRRSVAAVSAGQFVHGGRFGRWDRGGEDAADASRQLARRVQPIVVISRRDSAKPAPSISVVCALRRSNGVKLTDRPKPLEGRALACRTGHSYTRPGSASPRSACSPLHSGEWSP
jgi:hypothetical protein